MFPRHHRTEKTTTPWWNDGRYPVNVSLNPLGATVTIRHRTPMCRAFYRRFLPSSISRRPKEVPLG